MRKAAKPAKAGRQTGRGPSAEAVGTGNPAHDSHTGFPIRARKDPEPGRKAKAQGSPTGGRVESASGDGSSSIIPSPDIPVFAPGPVAEHILYSSPEPTPISPGPSDLPPAPTDLDKLSLSHYRGTALKNVGRDARGRVIPHKRSEIVARKVAAWAAGGYNKNDIAVLLNIRPGLVEECYGRELNHGERMVGMELTDHIVKRAKKSDRMAIFYAKSRMGWRDGDGKPEDTGILDIHIHL